MTGKHAWVTALYLGSLGSCAGFPRCHQAQSGSLFTELIIFSQTTQFLLIIKLAVAAQALSAMFVAVSFIYPFHRVIQTRLKPSISTTHDQR
ncbi:hypothetical protein QBC46DRAFT_101403 [Diplogelasinospora grovesii]|uniref:Uncharacterized protein n=1 Tax=Diplogelasinospora grovesii TaxID=303347 RepID=A0AAN6MXN9_9PEZI|nr:hypothetical protein QBC46DRAFT_101403 [Diplogelasinospora grovesii]